MTNASLPADELLATTRAVRRHLDLERPVDLALIRECLELALQAPSGSNAQGWQFVVVTDAEKRRRIGELYARAFDTYRALPFSAHALAAAASGDERPVMDGVVRSAEALARSLGRVPVHVIPCVLGRTDQATGPLALLGLGTAWTTLHLLHEKEVAELLGIPHDQVTQVALIPVAHVLGSPWKRAKRRPLDAVLHLDRW
jgi:nitroreductase